MEKIKKLFSNKSVSRIISLCVAAYALVCLIYYIVYGATYDYFDVAVLLLGLFGIAAAACYFLLDFESEPLKYVIAALALVAVACFSVAFALIIKNSVYVWADELNGIKMFGSRGGLAPVITLIVLFAIATVAQIVACFFNSDKKQQDRQTK